MLLSQPRNRNGCSTEIISLWPLGYEIPAEKRDTRNKKRHYLFPPIKPPSSETGATGVQFSQKLPKPHKVIESQSGLGLFMIKNKTQSTGCIGDLLSLPAMQCTFTRYNTVRTNFRGRAQPPWVKLLDHCCTLEVKLAQCLQAQSEQRRRSSNVAASRGAGTNRDCVLLPSEVSSPELNGQKEQQTRAGQKWLSLHPAFAIMTH